TPQAVANGVETVEPGTRIAPAADLDSPAQRTGNGCEGASAGAALRRPGRRLRGGRPPDTVRCREARRGRHEALPGRTSDPDGDGTPAWGRGVTRLPFAGRSTGRIGHRVRRLTRRIR